jgi:hypothetical protein
MTRDDIIAALVDMEVTRRPLSGAIGMMSE